MSLSGKDFAYPAMLNLKDKKCIIIGGGSVAARKLAALAKAGAAVTIVAPSFCSQLTELAENVPCQLISSAYDKKYLQDAFLVVAATDNFDVNRQITCDAPFLCNNITEPELSNFTVPSVIEAGSITIAVATGGVPAYTRLLKTYLSETINSDFAEFNDFLLTVRQQVKEIPSTPGQRTLFWRSVLTKEITELLETGNISKAKEKILDAVNSFRTQSQNGAC